MISAFYSGAFAMFSEVNYAIQIQWSTKQYKSQGKKWD